MPTAGLTVFARVLASATCLGMLGCAGAQERAPGDRPSGTVTAAPADGASGVSVDTQPRQPAAASFVFHTADGQTLPGRAEVRIQPAEEVTGQALPARVTIFLSTKSFGSDVPAGGGPGIAVEVAMTPSVFLALPPSSLPTTAPAGALVPGDAALASVFTEPSGAPTLLPLGTVSLTRSEAGLSGVVHTGADWGDITFEGVFALRCFAGDDARIDLGEAGQTNEDFELTTRFCAPFAGILPH
jgi:hypothetical protein